MIQNLVTQDQLNNSLSSYIVTENITVSMGEISPNYPSGDVDTSVSKSGYTPIFAIPYASSNQDWLVFTRCQIKNTNTLTVRMFNEHPNTKITANAYVCVVYRKNM